MKNTFRLLTALLLAPLVVVHAAEKLRHQPLPFPGQHLLRHLKSWLFTLQLMGKRLALF